MLAAELTGVNVELRPGRMTVKEAAERLERAAWTAGVGWLPNPWSRRGGAGPDLLSLAPIRYLTDLAVGNFSELRLVPGERTVLEVPLEAPPHVAGLDLRGDQLEMALYSVYPIEVAVDDRQVFVDRVPPVAAGPALFSLVDSVTGSDGVLRVTIDVPPQLHAAGWLHLRFTTPRLRRRQDQLELLAAQLLLGDAVASDDAAHKALLSAAELVPQDPLAIDAVALDSLVDEVQDRLAPLAARLREVEVHLVGHSHIDLAWLWTWEDTCDVIVRDVRSVLSLLDDYPEMTFTHSQPASYQVLRDREPALYARVLDHIATGRWEPATMQWVEADTNLPSGESAVRQLVEGVRFSEDELGFSPRVQLAPDTFGHAGNLPQLAVSAGARVYYHHRGNPGQARGECQWPAYWWEGQDGSRLLALGTPTYVGDLSTLSLAKALLGGAVPAHQQVALHFYGIGDHGGGPTRQSLDRARALRAVDAFPRLRFSTVSGYASALLSSGVELPTHRGESATIFEGCYTTHADTKRLNRTAENALVTAQTLAAAAGLDHRAELAQAWRDTLLHQFHDILDGSAIREAYAKHEQDCVAATRTALEVTERALGRLEHDVEGDVLVTNPLGVQRRDVVVVPGEGQGPVAVVDESGVSSPAQWCEDGLRFIADVPAFSTKGYRIVTSDVSQGPVVDEPPGVGDPSAYVRVSTRHLQAVVRRDAGIITSLVDRRTGRELVAYGMRRGSDYLDTARADLALNVLTAVTERTPGMSAWHFDEVGLEEHLIDGAATRVVEDGPVRVVLEVTRAFRSSRIVQRLVFHHDLPRIDLELDIDWQEKGSREGGVPGLKAAFTASLPEVQAWFETPYGAVQRPSNGQESPALRWAAVGGAEGGIAVLNDSKHGYDALGGRLRLSLLRSAFDPDPESDVGLHHLRLALLPYVGDWRDAGVVDEAAGFNQPLLARRAGPTAPTRCWRPQVGPGSVRVGTLDRAATGSARLVRLYEAHGVSGTVDVHGLGDQVWETTVTERRLRRVDTVAGRASLSFRPWQVRTLLVED